MATCEYLSICPFFNGKMAVFLPGTVELMKQRLCLAQPDECARYIVFKKLGAEHLPADLIPNDAERAKAILNAAVAGPAHPPGAAPAEQR